ncbi:hypothetical protein V8E36_003112 [Tilletia maclaganii]
MKFHLALLSTALLIAAVSADEVICRNLSCKKATSTKLGLVGTQCQFFLPGSGAPSLVPEPSCPDQPLCCKVVAPRGKAGAQCSRIYF